MAVARGKERKDLASVHALLSLTTCNRHGHVAQADGGWSQDNLTTSSSTGPFPAIPIQPHPSLHPTHEQWCTLEPVRTHNPCTIKSKAC